MAINKREYDEGKELHIIFDRLMDNFDRNPEADLTPKIDNIDGFLQLYSIQGRNRWLKFYESNPWDIIRFILAGSEKAFNLEPISKEYSIAEFQKILDRLTLGLSDEDSVNTDLIDDSIKLKAVPMILANRCFLVSYVCMLQHKEPIQLLINDARSGDREAFLYLVKLDSSFLYTKYGQGYIIEAELRNDLEFKAWLSDALLPDPKFWSLKNKRNHYMFLSLWMLDDYSLRDDHAWADFFGIHDIEKYSDVNNVRMQRKRYNLSQPE